MSTSMPPTGPELNVLTSGTMVVMTSTWLPAGHDVSDGPVVVVVDAVEVVVVAPAVVVVAPLVVVVAPAVVVVAPAVVVVAPPVVVVGALVVVVEPGQMKIWPSMASSCVRRLSRRLS